MECHKCKHQKAIAVLRREQERLAAICTECTAEHQKRLKRKERISNHGQRFSSLDSHEDAENLLAQAIVPKPKIRWFDEPAEEEAPDFIPTPVKEYLSWVIECFSSLTDMEAAVICRMLRNQTIQEIAEDKRMSKQRVSQIWRGLVAKVPVFNAVATGQAGMRVGCGCGRKPKGVNET